MAKYTLGISCFYHDSAAAITCEGEIIGALQEERLSRKKNDDQFPKEAIKKLLFSHHISPADIGTIVYYEKPFLTFERLLETFHGLFPRGFKSYLKIIPLWIKEKIFLKSLLREELEDLGIDTKKILFPEHHHSHMASAFYPSPFGEAAILTLDGVGEWKNTCLAYGKDKEISLLAHQDYPHSLGLFYSAFTAFCGFKVNNGEYKLMGLAPYAKAYPQIVSKFKKIIKENLIHIHDNGGFSLNLNYFYIESAFDLIPTKNWEELFTIKRLPLNTPLTKEHAALALACQEVTEEVILNLVKHLKELTGAKNLCLSGGVALNCVANGLLLQEKIFERIWIQPAAGDAGSALGAALLGDYLYQDFSRHCQENSMKGSLIGPSYSDEEIIRFLNTKGLQNYTYLKEEELVIKACEDLMNNKVIGWFQGALEFGPRALGNRSILAKADELENQKRVNLKIKKREGFRPFAPAVLDEDFEKLFGPYEASPFMQFVLPLTKEFAQAREQKCDYQDLPEFIKIQLGQSTSRFGAITHVDGSCRVQKVNQETQPLFWKLLSQVKKSHGIGLLLNTSFNIRGEPIVESPRDALLCFENTDLDILYLGNIRIEKKDS